MPSYLFAFYGEHSSTNWNPAEVVKSNDTISGIIPKFVLVETSTGYARFQFAKRIKAKRRIILPIANRFLRHRRVQENGLCMFSQKAGHVNIIVDITEEKNIVWFKIIQTIVCIYILCPMPLTTANVTTALIRLRHLNEVGSSPTISCKGIYERGCAVTQCCGIGVCVARDSRRGFHTNICESVSHNV
jgi:hypothetical protein